MFWTAVLSAALVAGLTVKETDDGIVVDVEGSDAFKVTIDNSGSISSLLYREKEYQYSGTLSHIASGLGSGASVNHTTEGSSLSQIQCPTHISNKTRELRYRFGHRR